MKITDQYDSTIRHLKESGSSGKAKASKAQKDGAQAQGDTVELSSLAKDVSKARTEVDRTPDIRAEKVESLKEKVSSGEYKVDPDKVAHKLVDEHLSELL